MISNAEDYVMRITEAEQQTIRQAITEVDPEADIYLFGSKADDNARGGDIDLLVISQKINLMDKLAVLAKLHRNLGEQKIDLAVFSDFSKPFARIAKQSGVPLP
jgi:predicted nucleotidyltransferase